MNDQARQRWLVGLELSKRHQFLSGLTKQECSRLLHHWPIWARAEQLPPNDPWRFWLICAGRGFGKTRAGSEWVRQIANMSPNARIALVAGSIGEARSIMVEGESGILACHQPDQRPEFEPSLKRLRWANGAVAYLYSAAEPESLRGPQHSHAWCDEIAKWDNASERAARTWDNLQMGLRLSNRPQVLATTTPRSTALMRQLLEREGRSDTVITRGTTFDNASNLPAAFLDAMGRDFGSTRLGRQELYGEILSDVEGALWTRTMLDQAVAGSALEELTRIVVAVDPPASANGDACGIVVAGLSKSGVGHVLADCSVEKASPERWARAVANAAQQWAADRVIAEANQGGAMVESVLRAADVALPVRMVHASRGKAARAEPVAALYEAGRVAHSQMFPQLEDQLCGMIVGGEYQGPGNSPDRADALVWALTELMLSGRSREPRVQQV